MLTAILAASICACASGGNGSDTGAGDAATDTMVSDTGDAGTVDGGDAGDSAADTSVDTSIPDGGTLGGQAYFSSGGGGSASSASHQLFMSVGAPQPMGEAQNASYRITVGPNAARP